MTEQQKTNQAENALEAVQHAVDQAESHPSDNKTEEAAESIGHAEAAVRQAADSGSGEADRLASGLRAEKETLGGTAE